MTSRSLTLIALLSVMHSALADIITPISVSSSTAGAPNPDFYPAINLINGGGLSTTTFTERTIHTVTHAVAGNTSTWVTAGISANYFDALPNPILTFSFSQETEINGFAYWGYIFGGGTQAEGNEAKSFQFTFRDAAGTAIGTRTLTSPTPTGLQVNVCSLAPISGVHSVDVEITDNHHPLDGGDRVGLAEVRFLGRQLPSEPLGNEAKIGNGGTLNHDPFFEDFGDSVRLNNGNVVIAYVARDNSVATPISPDGDDYGTYFRIYTPDGNPVSSTPTAPYLDVNAAGTGRQNRPLLTALNNGNFVITWSSSGATGDTLADTWARVYQADGTAVSGSFKVNESEPSGMNDDHAPVAITELSGGGFAIVWDDENDNSNNKDDYYVRSFSATGVANGASIALGGAVHNPFFQTFGNLIALDDGGFAACWVTRNDGTTPSPDGDNYGAFFQTFNANGSANSSVLFPYVDVNNSGTGRQSIPLLTPIANGFAMTWNSRGETNDLGDDGDVYTRVFSNNGTAVSSTIKVNDLTTQWGDTPVAITTLSNGNYVIAWQDNEDDGGPNQDDFFVRTYTPLGVAVGASIQLGDATHETLFQDFGNLIALDDNGFAVCWRTRSSGSGGTGTSADGTGYGAFLQVFNGDGSARSGLIIPYLDINPSGLGSQNSPRLLSIPNGFAATWNSANGPGDLGAGSNATRGGDTYTRLFDNQGTPLTATEQAHAGEPTGITDVQTPQALILSDDGYAVIVRDDNRNTDNKDDHFIRFFAFPGTPLDADLTNDGITDFSDLNILIESIREGSFIAAFDLDNSGTVDIADLDEFLSLTQFQSRTVTNNADSGNGSLRKILTDLNPSSTSYIQFASGLSGSTITLTTGEVVPTEDFYLDGSSVSAPPTLSGNDSSRILNTSSLTAHFDTLTFTDGNEGSGGAISSFNAQLTFSKCTLSNNRATAAGGDGGAIFGSGEENTINLVASTLSGNEADQLGGAIILFNGNLNITNSTFASNRADAGSAVWHQASAGSGAQADLFHTTISGNIATNQSYVAFVPTNMTSCIIAGNIPDLAPTISSNFTYLGSNLVTGDPRLAPLGDYGGSTQTMLPLPGSPAIDPTNNSGFSIDQRGMSRSSSADLGAVELIPNNDLPPLWFTDLDGDGNPLGVEVAQGTNPVTFDANDPRTVRVASVDAAGDSTLTFGWNPNNAPTGTKWVLLRSPDLVQPFVPIFRYDGDVVTLGSETNTSFDLINNIISYKDENAPAQKAFYRFEAESDLVGP